MMSKTNEYPQDNRQAFVVRSQKNIACHSHGSGKKLLVQSLDCRRHLPVYDHSPLSTVKRTLVDKTLKSPRHPEAEAKLTSLIIAPFSYQGRLISGLIMSTPAISIPSIVAARNANEIFSGCADSVTSSSMPPFCVDSMRRRGTRVPADGILSLEKPASLRESNASASIGLISESIPRCFFALCSAFIQ